MYKIVQQLPVLSQDISKIDKIYKKHLNIIFLISEEVFNLCHQIKIDIYPYRSFFFHKHCHLMTAGSFYFGSA